MITQISLPYPLNALHLLETLRPLGEPVLLDSGQPGSIARFGRYDILSAGPQTLVRCDPDGLQIRYQGLWRSEATDPFDYLSHILTGLDRSDVGLPFTGGLIGHWSYDLGRTIEQLPDQAEADINFPWMQVGFYLWAVVIDHHQEQAWLVAQPSCSARLLDQIQTLIEDSAQHAQVPAGLFELTSEWSANMTQAEYAEKLRRIDEYIRAGDCYQINFAQRFSAEFRGDCWAAYRKLREQISTPFSAYLESDAGTLISLSPERFIQISSEGQVETRPIKGTRPRSSDPDEDQRLANELANAAKDRSENLMIVDLLRNDLSRACQPGSVRVPELFAIESYPNVHHLVSAVTGQLAPTQSPVDLLKHAFPGGSITGAPKVRAMEIIDELEPQRRSAYCGSIGYISASGQMDTNICIRTLICVDNQIHCWAGGGIVTDSEIDDEYQETLNKVGNLLRILKSN